MYFHRFLIFFCSIFSTNLTRQRSFNKAALNDLWDLDEMGLSMTEIEVPTTSHDFINLQMGLSELEEGDHDHRTTGNDHTFYNIITGFPGTPLVPPALSMAM